MEARRRPLRFAAAALNCAGLFVVLATASPATAIAGCDPAVPPSPASSPSPSTVPEVGSVVSESPAPSPTPFVEKPLYNIGDEIYTEDHDGALHYFFQANPDGTGRAKYDMRYDRNLWDTCAQGQIRIPIVTNYPVVGNPDSGLGNIELGYSYNVASKTFDHSLQARIALPTESNNVESDDTQLKFFYDLKWKFNGLSIAYTNEYGQSITRPPGATYSSYYEGTLTLPDYSFVDAPGWKGLKLSGIYNYRFAFNKGGIFQPAAGLIMFGNINDVALNLVDSWGMGEHALWKYKVEATAVARF